MNSAVPQWLRCREVQMGFWKVMLFRRLYYENATHQLRNDTKTQKNKLYESARKRYTETHGITVRKRTIPAFADDIRV